jgi:hypothetical protein
MNEGINSLATHSFELERGWVAWVTRLIPFNTRFVALVVPINTTLYDGFAVSQAG